MFTARGPTKVYGESTTAVHALHRVDPDIAQGELIVLLGASGRGTFTRLNRLGGLDSATSGSTHWTHDGQVHELIGADDAELTRYRREHLSPADDLFTTNLRRPQCGPKAPGVPTAHAAPRHRRPIIRPRCRLEAPLAPHAQRVRLA